ncbi:LysR family transcriptional regulator [Streptomyces sp. NPDC002346]
MIDLHKLEHFVAVAKTESFVQAAERLHLSQSALSRSIQALERYCGVALFDRSRSGVYLTATGRQVLAQAEDLLFNAQSLERVLGAAASGIGGNVSFGIGPNSAFSLLPKLLPRLFRDYPKVQVKVVIGSVGTMLQNLSDGEIEFFVGLVDPLHASERISVEELTDAGPGFFVRPEHPLLGAGPVRLRALQDYPRLSGTAWNETLHSLAPDCRDWVRATVEVDNFELLLGIAVQTDAIVISTEGAEVPSLVELDVDSSDTLPGRSRIGIYALHGRTLSPASTTVASILREAASSRV